MKNRFLSKNLRVALIGAVMGIAEAIPGVSGGTIAFVFKIYRELLETIKSFTPSSIGLVFRGKLVEFFKRVNGTFLLFLGVGMVLGIVIGVFAISFLIENEKEALWAFFFGLVLASSVYLAKDIKWRWWLLVLFLIGVLISYSILLITPAAGSDNPLFIFFCGLVAVSALMLPGLSGSFILLLLGMYTKVIGSLKNLISSPGIGEDLRIMVLFACGCLVGLITFSRALSYTFKRYFEPTMAIMIGILVGSLSKLWPWKIPVLVLDKISGEIISLDNTSDFDFDNLKIVKEINALPGAYVDISDPKVFIVIISFLLGLGLIASIYLYEKSTTENVVSPEN